MRNIIMEGGGERRETSRGNNSVASTRQERQYAMPNHTSVYNTEFLKQYVKIDNNISETLNTLYADEYEGVRHCLGLIIVNLLHYGEVAVSRNPNFYTQHHTKHFRYAGMKRALEIAITEKYAKDGRLGYNRLGGEKGRSS